VLPEPVLLPHYRSVELTLVSNQEGHIGNASTAVHCAESGRLGDERACAYEGTEERSERRPFFVIPRREATAKDCSVTTTAVRYRMRQARR
jgi:hypothetical protein